MCRQNVFSYLSKFPLGFVCHRFLQSGGSELLFQQSAGMRIPVSFDMLDPALCVAWRILKLLLKLHNSLWRKFFLLRLFCQLKVCKFHHTMVSFKCISSYFRGLKIKNFPGSMPPDPPRWLTLTRSKSTPPPPIVNLPRNSVSDNQSSAPAPFLETCPSGLIWSVSFSDCTSP